MTDELRKLAEAATPGPWRKRWYGSGGYEGREGVTVVTDTGTISCDEIAYLGRGDTDEDTAQRSRNGAFIAAASPDEVLGLLDEIERLKTDNRYKYGDGYEAAGIALVGERDEARAAVRRLAVALSEIAKGIIDRKYATAGMMMNRAAEAINDEAVWRIVEGS